MRLSVYRAGPVAPARSTSRRVVFALCALWCSTVTPLLAQHLNDTGQGNCHHATASIRTPDPATAGFDAQNCTHEVAATVDAASAVSASPQVSPRGMPEKPAGLDDASWDALQQAIRKAGAQQARLSPEGDPPGADGAASDLFGYSVDLDGDTALVGAISDDVGANTNQGSAYVFTRSGSTWTQEAKLTAGDGAVGDRFGSSVALDGDTALVGAYPDAVGGNSYQGSAYVFTRSGNTWTQQAKLVAADGAASDYFGWSVAVDGDTALVGAVLDAVGANSFQGSVYVFARSGTTWTQQAELTAGDGETYDLFGTSVALDGDTALVGAYGDNVGAASDQGSAYVFTRSDTTWTQQAKLVAGDGARGDEFGYSVALDGDTALVGAYQDYVGANSGQGSAYVFTRSDTTWTQQTKLVAGDGEAGDRFGISVALDGDTALVGAHSTGALNINPGSAYVFTRGGTTWLQQAKLLAGDGVELDLFGTSVDLDGDTALVGAHGYDVGVNSYQGSAYVFTRRGTTWAQAATLTAATGAAADHFGTSVALSSTMALVGAPNVDGLPPYGNPDEGAAYVFRIVLTMFANGFEEPARAITVPRR